MEGLGNWGITLNPKPLYGTKGFGGMGMGQELVIKGLWRISWRLV